MGYEKKAFVPIFITVSFISLFLLVAVFCAKKDITIKRNTLRSSINPKMDIRKSNINNVLSSKYENKATALFFIDDRSRISVENAIKLCNYLSSTPIGLKLIIVRVHRGQKTIDYPGCELVDVSVFIQSSYRYNAVYLFDSQGAYRSVYELTDNIKLLLTKFDDVLGIPVKSTSLSSENLVGKNIKNTALHSIIGNNYKINKYNCFFFNNELCPSCKSGELLAESDSIQKKYNEVQCSYYLFNEYSEREMVTYRKEYALLTNIYIQNPEAINDWRNYENEIDRIHPLKEAIVLIDPNGNIILVTKKVVEIHAKLGELFKNNQGGL